MISQQSPILQNTCPSARMLPWYPIGSVPHRLLPVADGRFFQTGLKWTVPHHSSILIVLCSANLILDWGNGWCPLFAPMNCYVWQREQVNQSTGWYRYYWCQLRSGSHSRSNQWWCPGYSAVDEVENGTIIRQEKNCPSSWSCRRRKIEPEVENRSWRRKIIHRLQIMFSDLTMF